MTRAIALSLAVLFASVACKPRRDNASTALADQSGARSEQTPPPRVYHFGSYDTLAANGQDATALARGWSKIVANDNPFRQGLYVAQNPAYAEQYGNAKIGIGYRTGPWLMEAVLASDCLDPARILPVDMQQLASYAPFQTWYQQTAPSLRPAVPDLATFQSQCARAAAFDPLFVQQGQPSACAQTVQQYLKNPGAGGEIMAVKDHLWPGMGFWYLRSAQCVADVNATPEDAIRILASFDTLWMMKPFGDAERPNVNDTRRKPGEALALILARAIFEARTLDETNLRKIGDAASRSDITAWDVRTAIPKITAGAARCARYANGKAQIDHVLYDLLMVLTTKENTDGGNGVVGQAIADYADGFEYICKRDSDEQMAATLRLCVKPIEEIYGMFCEQSPQAVAAIRQATGQIVSCNDLNNRADAYGNCVPTVRCVTPTEKRRLDACIPAVARLQMRERLSCMELVARNDRFGVCPAGF